MSETEILLDIETHFSTNGWLIFDGTGKQLAVTMLTPTRILSEAPGKTMSDKLRWVIESGQIVPEDRWR